MSSLNTELLLVRHGQTRLHKLGIMVSWDNDPGLDDEGKRQVTHLAEQLGKRFQDRRIKAVYTSPLPRAKQTADIIADYLSLSLVHVEVGLKDISIGKWEGQPLKKIRNSDIGKQYFSDPVGVRLPGGEEITEVHNRVIPVIERIQRTHPDGPVVVVSHADVIKLILVHYFNGDLHNLHDVAPVPLASCTNLKEWIKRA